MAKRFVLHARLNFGKGYVRGIAGEDPKPASCHEEGVAAVPAADLEKRIIGGQQRRAESGK
jgi:hypothetical protein